MAILMRCGHCQQEMAEAVDDAATPCCAHCGPPSEASPTSTFSPLWADDWEPWDARLDLRLPVDLDDWQLEDDLRTAERLVRRVQARLTPRIDAAQPLPSSSHTPDSPPAVRPGKTSSGLGWFALSLGIMLFACGGVLIGWSLATARPALWNIGLPLTLAGQVGLLLGVVLQLEAVWRSHRQTAELLASPQVQPPHFLSTGAAQRSSVAGRLERGADL